MTPGHSPEQWRELYARITALIADPMTSGERRRRAEEVMGIMRRDPEAVAALRQAPPSRPTRLTDNDWTDEYL